MRQRIIMIVLIVIIIVGGGFYAYKQLMSGVQETDTEPLYATHEVARGDITVGVNTVGQLNPSDGGGITVSDALRATGYSGELIVEEILAKEGDSVNKGQLLVRLSASGIDNDIADLEDQIKRKKMLS